jgi:uncharacterized protein (DUF2267 family)
MNKPMFLARVQRSAGLTSAKEAERWSVAVVTALISDLEAKLPREITARLEGRGPTPGQA